MLKLNVIECQIYLLIVCKEFDKITGMLTSNQEYQAVVDAEWNILYDKLHKLHQSGAKVVLSKLPIGDVATQFFADRFVFTTYIHMSISTHRKFANYIYLFNAHPPRKPTYTYTPPSSFI